MMLVLRGYKITYAYNKITPTCHENTFNFWATLWTVNFVVLKHALNENHKQVIICTITLSLNFSELSVSLHELT